MHFAFVESEELFNTLLNLVDQFKLTSILQCIDNRKQNLLHIAAFNDKSKYIKLLIKMGTKPNQMDIDGNTPLHIAIIENNLNCITEILSVNNKINTSKIVDINIFNDNSQTPLFLAIQQKKFDIIKILLNYGASTQLCDIKNENNILHMAVELNWFHLVEYILMYKYVDVNRKNRSNFTALDLAMAQQPTNNDIVKLLLEYDAVETINKDDTDTDETSSLSTNEVPSMLVDEIMEDKVNIASGVYNLNISNKNDILNNATVPKLVSIENHTLKNEIKTEVDEGNDYVLDVADRLHINNSNFAAKTNNKSQANKQSESLFDDICLNDLCIVFNRANKWNELAIALGYQAFADVWKTSKNPSKMLFKFSEVIFKKLFGIFNIFNFFIVYSTRFKEQI